MKKKIFNIIFLVSIILIFISFLSPLPKDIHAQGTCIIKNNDCTQMKSHCDAGFKADNSTCGQQSGFQCFCIPDLATEKGQCLAKNKPPLWIGWVWIEGKGCFEKVFQPAEGEKCPEGWRTETRGNWSLCVYDGKSGTSISPIQPKTCTIGTSGSYYTGNTYEGIQTAIGCIPIEPKAFVSTFINWAIGIAGGLAFLLMLFSAFGILTSAGDPEKLKASQEKLTSAIIGLLFIIFSVFLLRIIGTPIMELGSTPPPG